MFTRTEDTVAELFSDDEVCRTALDEARTIMSSAVTTRPQYIAMQKALSLMQVHCSPSMHYTVEAVVYEAELRRVYFELGIWNTERK